MGGCAAPVCTSGEIRTYNQLSTFSPGTFPKSTRFCDRTVPPCSSVITGDLEIHRADPDTSLAQRDEAPISGDSGPREQRPFRVEGQSLLQFRIGGELVMHRLRCMNAREPTAQLFFC